MHNVLTSEEIAQGWQLLFNGESTQGWRHYNGGELRSGVDSGWMAVDGTLSFVPPNGLAEGTEAEGEGSDVVTARSFGSFELSLEFRVGPRIQQRHPVPGSGNTRGRYLAQRTRVFRFSTTTPGLTRRIWTSTSPATTTTCTPLLRSTASAPASGTTPVS